MELFEGTFFYVSAAVLVVLVLVAAFIGMRSESFPGKGRTGGILIGITTLMVAVVCVAAVAEARHEQENRRAEIAETEKEEATEQELDEGSEGPVALEEGDPDGEDQNAPGITEEQQENIGPETASVDGAEVFASEGCGSCHALQAANSAGQIGPSLDAELENEDAEFIRTSIIDPNAQISEGFGEGIMPTNYAESLTEVQLDALVEYLVKSTGGN